MRVLIACEFSGIVRDAFKAKGHDAWSCDLLPSEAPGQHYQFDIEGQLYAQWDLIIAHPPCTYLANSGAKHLYIKGKKTNGKDLSRWDAMRKAAAFFNLFKSKSCNWCIENPIPHGHAESLIGHYAQIIQPWQFGHGETKATCLWLHGLPLLKPTDIVDGRKPRVHYESPGPDRWKNRSRTLPGIAGAMAEQWG